MLCIKCFHAFLDQLLQLSGKSIKFIDVLFCKGGFGKLPQDAGVVNGLIDRGNGFIHILFSHAEAYANLYDEIVQGYENGTRQINVIDENSEQGYRTLTMEEELSALDAAYEKNVKGFEEYAAQQNKARTIIGE